MTTFLACIVVISEESNVEESVVDRNAMTSSYVLIIIAVFYINQSNESNISKGELPVSVESDVLANHDTIPRYSLHNRPFSMFEEMFDISFLLLSNAFEQLHVDNITSLHTISSMLRHINRRENCTN